MAVDKLVDSTQLDSDLTSVANAIRAKGGTSASLVFPSDFITAIGNISGGGSGDTGAISGNYYSIHYAKVTAGTNTVTNALNATKYLLQLANVTSPGALVVWGVVDEVPTASRVNNQLFGHVLTSIGTAYTSSGSGNRKLYRWRSSAMQNTCQETTSYDGKIVSGLSYWIIWTTGSAPT